MTQIPRLPRSILYQPPAPVRLREDELDLLGIFRLIRRRIWLIIAIGAVLTMAAVPVILSMKREYYAGTRILIQRPLTASLVIAGTDRPLDLTTEVERLLSRDIAVRVIKEFDLKNREEFNPELRREPTQRRVWGWLRGLVLGEEAEEPPKVGDPMDLMIPEFLGALTVSRDATSDVIQIGFTSEDAKLAAEIPNALVRIYLNEREENLRSQVDAARNWLVERIAERRGRVSAAHLAIKDFRDTSGLVSDVSQADAARTISTLSARRSAITTARAELVATLTGLKSNPSGFEAIDTEAMADLRRELLLQQHELARLHETFGDSHPEVVRTRAKIRQIETAIEAEVEEYTRSLRTRMAALDLEDQAILEGLDAARSTLSRLNQIDAELTSLQRSAETEQKALDDLEQQLLALDSQAELPAAQVEVLSPATVSQWPLGRSRFFYLLGAMVAAGLIGLTVACIREMLDRSLRSHQQLEGLAGILPAGMIPRLPPKSTRSLSDLLEGQPGGIFADAMRGLVLTLERGNAGSMPRSLVVTSALPNEGKSLTATALALTLAASRRRVLLVDADLRHGRVHELLGGSPAPGLAELLAGECNFDEVIRHDETSGVDYITRGNPHAAACDAQQAAWLIQHTRKHDHQVVIFDCAPVLATSNTSTLVGVAEQTLLVIRWGKTRRRFVELALQRLLGSSGNNDIVTVLTMMEPRRHALYSFKDAGIFTGELRRYFS